MSFTGNANIDYQSLAMKDEPFFKKLFKSVCAKIMIIDSCKANYQLYIINYTLSIAYPVETLHKRFVLPHLLHIIFGLKAQPEGGTCA